MNVSFIKNGYQPSTNGITELKAKEINPSLYRADLRFEGNKKGLISFYKAYEDGWTAYGIKNHESGIMNYAATVLSFVFGDKIEQHVKVNGWANGWTIKPPTINSQQLTIVIVYLPQYLEYAGFAILGITFAFIVSRFAISKLSSRIN